MFAAGSVTLSLTTPVNVLFMFDFILRGKMPLLSQDRGITSVVTGVKKSKGPTLREDGDPSTAG